MTEMTLDEAIKRVLANLPEHQGSLETIQDEIERRGLLETSGVPSLFQIGSRANNYSDMFEIIVKLRE